MKAGRNIGSGWWRRAPSPCCYHPANREITPADAEAIATGFLRWNGNHSWKVVDVKPLSDDEIGFAYATPDNTVIARFTINSHTGHIKRVG